MSWIKPAAPWFYLFWKEVYLPPEHEIALARMTRREGLFYMMRLYWHIIAKEDDGGHRYVDLECFWIFLAQNYPPFLCFIGYWVGLDDCLALCGVWFLTFAYGSVRNLAWLIALLYRWPPLAKG